MVTPIGSGTIYAHSPDRPGSREIWKGGFDNNRAKFPGLIKT
jgi:hypothetical protein